MANIGPALVEDIRNHLINTIRDCSLLVKNVLFVLW